MDKILSLSSNVKNLIKLENLGENFAIFYLMKNINDHKLIISEIFNWKYEKYLDIDFWYSGDKDSVCKIIKELSKKGINQKTLKQVLYKQYSSFSIIAKLKSNVFAATDFSRSFPIFYGFCKNKIVISNDARSIKNTSKENMLNESAILECMASGFVSGNNTLYSNIKQLGASQYLLFDSRSKKYSIGKYFIYHNKKKIVNSESLLLKELDNTINLSINRLIKYSKDRRIIVPISGGLDSRLILCKLVEAGYRNLFSFSYGPKGNSDAKIANKVSKKLGVKWEFINISSNEYKEFYNSSLRKKYTFFSDGLNSVPNYQDLIVIHKLKNNYKNILKDSVIVNGQTGDFSSGGHIPESLTKTNQSIEILYKEIIKKHYSLWKNLLTPNNISILKKKIDIVLFNKCFKKSQSESNTKILGDLFERWEYEERQIKFIVNGQRAYDFFELDWYLPLWDGNFVKFWSKVPLELRFNQKLYKMYLEQWNFMNLFKDFRPTIRSWNNYLNFTILPISILLGKLVGKKKRDRYIRYFDYFSRYGNHYHSFGFKTFLYNIHKMRNPISLYTVSWLSELGLIKNEEQQKLKAIIRE